MWARLAFSTAMASCNDNKLQGASELSTVSSRPKRSIQSLDFLNIGDDALFTIFTQLDVFDLLSLSQTCKKMNEISKMAGLWKRNCQIDFKLPQQTLPKEVESYYHLYKILYTLHILTTPEAAWTLTSYLMQHPLSMAGFLLYRNLPQHISREGNLGKMDAMMVESLWSFSTEEMQKYDGRVLNERRFGHVAWRELQWFPWEDLYDYAIKLHGREEWESIVLRRQIEGFQQLVQTVESVRQKQRSSRLLKWISTWQKKNPGEHQKLGMNYPATCLASYYSNEPLHHPFVWDIYMKGKLFPGLRAVENYCKCFKKLGKYLVLQPELAKNKEWRSEVGAKALHFMVTYLSQAMYIDLVSSERMLRVAKLFVKASLQVYAIPDCTLALYTYVSSTSPYKYFFETQSEEDLEKIEQYIKAQKAKTATGDNE